MIDAARAARLPTRAIHGVFYRAVPAAAAPYALEDGPSYRYLNRYNVAERFGALYFADRIEVCRATLEKRGLLAARALPHILISFKIKVDGIVDLTDADVRRKLGVERQDLVRSAERLDAYSATHEMATALYAAGFSGLQAPDATETGQTLVLYPARLLARATVRVKAQQSF